MPELRKDPVVGRWVIIATERARRPGNFIDPQGNVPTNEDPCPFCEGVFKVAYEMKDDALNKDGSPLKVTVVERRDAVLKPESKYKRRGHGLYDVVNGFGIHEVVVESPKHIANMADLDENQIRLIIQAYVARFNELEKNKNVQYILILKNYGTAAGSRNIWHSRSQIIASPINPLRVKEKLSGAKRHFDYHERCLYCDLIKQEMETQKRIIAQNDNFLAITPFAPRFPFEVLIIPKVHSCDFNKGVVGKEGDMARILKEVLLRIKVGLDDPAYNFVIQSAPLRREKKGNKWKTIEDDYHWHIEVMPRLTRAAGFEKGSGFYICPIPPEDTAEFLREVQI